MAVREAVPTPVARALLALASFGVGRVGLLVVERESLRAAFVVRPVIAVAAVVAAWKVSARKVVAERKKAGTSFHRGGGRRQLSFVHRKVSRREGVR